MTLAERLTALVSGRGSDSRGAAEIMKSTLLIGSVVVAFGCFGILDIWIWSVGLGWLTKDGVTHSPWLAFGSASLVAGASAAIGGLLGFIFGIPRTLDPATRLAVATAGDAIPVEKRQAALAANTNLERVSDWLTTLLIGATLVQIKDIARWLGRIGTTLFTPPFSEATVVPLIVVYFSALSFLGVYLVTRLYLTYALQQTLALLTGTTGYASVAGLKTTLTDALASADPAEAVRGIALFDGAILSDVDAADPAINAILVRLSAKVLASKSLSGRKDATVAQLKVALGRAIASDEEKRRLVDSCAAGDLTTGIDSVDLSIKTTLGVP